ncbi:MAG: 2-succinylbenzoate--CoA ligase [Pleurocapsa sp.]
MLNDQCFNVLKKLTKKQWLSNLDNEQLLKLIQQKSEQLSKLVPQSEFKLKVLIAQKDEIEFIATFFACVINHVDLFLCNPYWQQQEWQQVLSLVNPDLVFADFHTKQIISQVHIDSNKKNNINNFFEHSLIMIPTGGTSGKIKFTIHTWLSLTASVTGFCNYFNLEKVNSFCVLPLYHVSGLMQLIRSFLTQGNLFVLPYKVLKRELITSIDTANYFISLVPTQLQFLIDLSSEWLAEFHTVLLGGAPATPLLLERARKHNISLAPTYGMTETASQIATLKPQDFLKGNNNSGRVLPHAVIKILDQQGNILNIEQTGLINIKADSLFLGYYPQILEPNRVFATDDLGWFDEAGYLHIVGRDSHKIITGGENVFPIEVERAILNTKLVKDVCVIGIPDAYWGEAVTAIYVPLKNNLDFNLIEQKIRSQLSKYKQPKHWIAVEQIERSDRGKINYQKLATIAKNYLDNK